MLNSERANTFLLTLGRNARTLPSSLLLVIVLEVLEIKIIQIRSKVILIYQQMTQSHMENPWTAPPTHIINVLAVLQYVRYIYKINICFYIVEKNLTIKFRRQLF